jgi:hypothetical protein
MVKRPIKRGQRHSDNMKRFYKYEFELEERYYTNLKKLCAAESAAADEYNNIYYAIKRLKKGFWSDGKITVTLCEFS